MASSHARRTNRSNTWPHRPALHQRQQNPCQRGVVHTWHDSAVRLPAYDVRSALFSGRALTFADFDLLSAALGAPPEKPHESGNPARRNPTWTVRSASAK
jgi:hypothetical protein